MSTLSPRPLLAAFLPSVNALLAALALPFTIDHPTDLTPSLLLAIFESLISARLPIPPSIRQSRTREAKSRAMLVLLGVLECDVLRGGTDADADHSISASNVDDSVLGGAGGVSVDGWVDEIGLGEVNPERLADGGWEETIFIGELLCWLARRKGILPRTKFSNRSSRSRSLYSSRHSYGIEEGEGETADFSTSLLLQPSTAQRLRSPRAPSPSIDNSDADPDSSTLSHITDVPRHPLVHSPEPSLSVSATTGTDLSIRARSVSSHTSVSNLHDDLDEFEGASQDTVQMYDPLRMTQEADDDDDDRPPTFRPRCIHEMEDPSYIRVLAGPPSSFDLSVPHQHVSEDEEDDPARDEDADEQDNDDLYAPPTPTPRRVRLTGWIDSVDAATELSHFAASRSHSHSRSRRLNANAGIGLAQPSQPHSHARARPGEPSKPTSHPNTEVSPRPRPVSGKSRTPRRASPSPSPPLSPLPSTSSSKYPPPRLPSSPPLSPPSPTHSDPEFDVSFSTLNNTSTPAKPRPPRRPQFQKTPRHEIETDTHVGVDRGKSGGSVGTATGRPPLHRRDRSPSYTPSPPSFTTPGSSRNGDPGGGASGTRVGSSVAKTRLGLPGSSTKGLSPPGVAPAGSTATTNTLLTERARLLTELAALKRVRAASGGGTSGSSGGVVSHRVGVGV